MTTVGDVIAILRPETLGELKSDVLLSGSPDTQVHSVAIAFSASHAVIRQAIADGVDLLVTHEGVYYSHFHDPARFASDPVAREKSELIARSGLAIYRCHDFWHRKSPDGIMEGLVRAVGWEAESLRHEAVHSVVELARAVTAGDIVRRLKERLRLPGVRVVGDFAQPCRRIGLTAGYRGGGELALPLFERERLDLLVVGEGPEWETPEYVADAVAQGRTRTLVVLGHAESEAPGMRLLADWLGERLPGARVRFLESPPSLRWA